MLVWSDHRHHDLPGSGVFDLLQSIRPEPVWDLRRNCDNLRLRSASSASAPAKRSQLFSYTGSLPYAHDGNI